MPPNSARPLHATPRCSFAGRGGSKEKSGDLQLSNRQNASVESARTPNLPICHNSPGHLINMILYLSRASPSEFVIPLAKLKRPWPSGLPSLHAGKDDDISLNSPLMWLRNGGNPGFQSLRFQGMGITPWMQMQPRFDTPILGTQPDMYQAVVAAGLQQTRTVDATKHISPQMLQFQQTPNITSRTSSILASEVVQNSQPQPPQTFHPSIQINQIQGQSQSEFLQHQLSFSKQQQQQKILQMQVPPPPPPSGL
ncbi:auxin response factor 6-like isoform X1 [Canna indica]|uniref:Auxin response factor 6-like isoform X1 n=1 Tax=Canna indica TaxID=4628 RepID=A0AAQ3QCV9_9LILI|nr:auxin response factor 6-like isoform X1 [Canna indica]